MRGQSRRAGRGESIGGDRAGHQATPPAKNASQALAADLSRLGDAETASPRDRKHLLRTLVADVTLLPQPDSHTVRLGMCWYAGVADELTIAGADPGRTPDVAVELMRRHGAAHTSACLAEMLNAAGLTRGKGKPYTASNVTSLRNAYEICGPRTVAIQTGEVRVKQAATELGIPRRRGLQLTAPRAGPGPPRSQPAVVRPMGPDAQAVYRGKVTESFRLEPRQPTDRH